MKMAKEISDAGKETNRDTSVTLKIHMYRSDTKCRERNIGGDITIHLILLRATLTFFNGQTPSFTMCDSA
jgi:hypothetical protein